MKIEELANLLNKLLENYSDGLEKKNDEFNKTVEKIYPIFKGMTKEEQKIINKKRSYLVAYYQENDIKNYMQKKSAKLKLENLYGAEKDSYKDNLDNYNHNYDQKNGDFFAKIINNGYELEEIRFDLKVSTKSKDKNKRNNSGFVGPIATKSWNSFKAGNHYYLCLAYNGNKLFLVDSTGLEESFFDYKSDEDDLILGKKLVELSKKNKSIVEIKI